MGSEIEQLDHIDSIIPSFWSPPSGTRKSPVWQLKGKRVYGVLVDSPDGRVGYCVGRPQFGAPGSVCVAGQLRWAENEEDAIERLHELMRRE